MEKKLYRSPDKKLCGVCAGVADYLNFDPTIIRIIVALIGIYTAVIPTLLVYFIFAMIIPKAPEFYYQIFNNTSTRLKKGHDKKIAGVCSGFAERFGFDPTIVRVVFVLLVVALGTGLFAYIACAILMPPCDDDYQGQQYGAPPYNQSQNAQYQNNPYNGQSYSNPPYGADQYRQPNQNQNPNYNANQGYNNQYNSGANNGDQQSDTNNE